MDPDSAYSPLERIVRAQEDAIRHNLVESLFAFDASGNVVFSKTGGKSDVELDLLEVARLQNTVVTHNHPSGLLYAPNDPRAQGQSFSLLDLQVATTGDVAEMRVVTSDWRFRILRPPTGWSFDYWRRTLEPAYQCHYNAVVQELLIELIEATISEAEAGAHFYHEIWTRVARELGLEYYQEK